MPKHFNPNNERDYRKLREARDESFKRLEAHRSHALAAKRQFVGKHYGPSDISSTDRVPTNFLELAVSIFLRQIASSAPSVFWATDRPLLRPTAASAELAHNNLLKEINYVRAQRLWISESLFSLGVMKVGITSKGLGEAGGFLHDAGQIFADPVFADDEVHDVFARRWEQVQFAGDRYQMPLPAVVDAYKLGGEDELRLQSFSEPVGTIMQSGDTRSDALSLGTSSSTHDTLVPMVDVWDLWLPYENLVVVVSDALDQPLNVIEWTGPEEGPYHRIFYEDVPGNLMPLPPVALMRDLHDLANRLFLKLGRQAERQKSNIGYRGGAEGESERVRTSIDGEHILMNDPDALRAYKSGGIDQTTFMFWLQIKDIFSYMMGNLDSIGGLGPQADTLGQEQLLASSASRRLDDMRDAIFISSGSVQQSIANYIWHDPTFDRTFSRRIGGSGADGLDVELRFASDLKEGDLIQYNIDILPNSMNQLTPSERLRVITQVITQFVLPMASLLAEQGVRIDIRELFSIIARYTGVSELRNIIQIGKPPPITGVGSARPGAQGGTKETVRRNIPGASRSGKDAVLSQALVGQQPQPSEAAAVFRPTTG